MKKIVKVLKRIMTKEVIFTLLNFSFKIISGPILLLFIPLFLQDSIQGYWYTFSSLAALSIFADMGFTTIVTQFSAYEYAYLSFNEKEYIEGDVQHLSMLASLLRFILKYSTIICVVAFPVIMSIGVYMFKGKEAFTVWLLPWMIYICASALNFIINVLMAFMEGCDQIARIQKNRFYGSITTTITTLIMLYRGYGLYSLALGALFGGIVNSGLFLYEFRISLKQLIYWNKNFIHSWNKDFLSLIWKYAISYSSGYFIFQIYTPLVFQFYGAELAGKVGISMSLCSAIYSISTVWIYINTPQMNMYAAQKKWSSMDKTLVKGIILSCATFLIGGVAVIAVLLRYQTKILILRRFLSVLPIFTLLCAWFIQIIVNSIAVYLRAHKQEPFMILSVVSGIYILICTFIIVKYCSINFLFMGFFTAQVLGLPWGIRIFYKKRRLWHI